VEVLFVALYALSVFPVFLLFLQQQLTLLVCLSWLGFVGLHLREKEGWSGAALALALVKPHMVLLPVAYLLYRRRWAALRSFSALAGLLVLVSIALSGPSVIVDYPRFLLDSTTWEGTGVDATQMFGWNGILADLTGDATPNVAFLLVLDVLTLGLVGWSWSRARPDLAAGPLAVALCASALISPHIYLYDMLFASLALALGAAQRLRTTGSPGLWLLGAGLFWLANVPWPGFSFDHGLPLISVATAVLLVALCRVQSAAGKSETAVDRSSPGIAAAA
jgi:hypothetical protein